MTNEERDALNREVATKVMGWSPHTTITGKDAGWVDPVQGGMGIVDFTAPEGCELVKAKMRELGYYHGVSYSSYLGLWHAAVHRTDAPARDWVAPGSTEYIAFLKAAVKAMEATP